MYGWMDGKGEEIHVFFSLSSRFILTASFAPIKRCLEIFYIIAERKRQGAVSLYLAWSVSSSPCQAEVAKHSARAAVRRNRYMYRYRGPWRTERRQTAPVAIFRTLTARCLNATHDFLLGSALTCELEADGWSMGLIDSISLHYSQIVLISTIKTTHK